MRLGSMEEFNPLTSRSSGHPIVLDVAIRGKRAAAYGRTFEELRRAGPPEDLERELRRTIAWAPDLTGLPRNILIVGDDGTEVIARLRFMRCLASGKPRPAQEQPKPPLRRAPAVADPLPLGTIY